MPNGPFNRGRFFYLLSASRKNFGISFIFIISKLILKKVKCLIFKKARQIVHLQLDW